MLGGIAKKVAGGLGKAGSKLAKSGFGKKALGFLSKHPLLGKFGAGAGSFLGGSLISKIFGDKHPILGTLAGAAAAGGLSAGLGAVGAGAFDQYNGDKAAAVEELEGIKESEGITSSSKKAVKALA